MEPKWIDKLIRILYDIGRVYPFGETGVAYLRIEVNGNFFVDTDIVDKEHVLFNFEEDQIEFYTPLDDDEHKDNHRDLTNVMNALIASQNHTVITKIEYYVVSTGQEYGEGTSFFSLHPLMFRTIGEDNDGDGYLDIVENGCGLRPTMDTLHFFPMPREEDKEFFEPFIEGPGLKLIRLFKDLENHMGHVRHVVLIQRSWRAFRARRAAWALGVITEFGLRPGHLLYKRGMSRFYT